MDRPAHLRERRALQVGALAGRWVWLGSWAAGRMHGWLAGTWAGNERQHRTQETRFGFESGSAPCGLCGLEQMT